MFGLEASVSIILVLCLVCALAFEFINGFHDTANAVATVIYTNSLRPIPAVVWSGVWNCLGVFAGGISVAMGIINLLPIDTLIDADIYHSIALVLSILITAIIWNLGTWWLGIPCSSSHTLIGSILGAGIGFSFLSDSMSGSAVNWSKAGDIGLSLLFSPLFGFGLTVFLMLVLKLIFSENSRIFKEPPPGEVPPVWIRAILILTCTGVSFNHGSNDGQKGIGLIMLILVSIVPVQFALNVEEDIVKMKESLGQVQVSFNTIAIDKLSANDAEKLSDIRKNITWMLSEIGNKQSVEELPDQDRFEFRKHILLMEKFHKDLSKKGELTLNEEQAVLLTSQIKAITLFTNYAPNWTVILVALSLGIGTMVGWKRIVVTIGEKIGKQHLTYAQGASAEMVAAGTIGLASGLGLPVSTTQVLSSGIAGSMVASNGLKNLQAGTIKSILIAWLLTFPVCVSLAAGLFLLFRWLF